MKHIIELLVQLLGIFVNVARIIFFRIISTIYMRRVKPINKMVTLRFVATFEGKPQELNS